MRLLGAARLHKISLATRANMLGDKPRGGFYKKTKGNDGKRLLLALDLETLEYRPKADKPRFDDLQSVVPRPHHPRKIHGAMRADGRAGTFLRAVYLPLFNYAASLVGSSGVHLRSAGRRWARMRAGWAVTWRQRPNQQPGASGWQTAR